MKYLKVRWNHTFANEPCWLYSEIDQARWEIRKVEIFSDGKLCFADKTRNSGTTKLGIEPLPELLEISADPQFESCEIAKEEFENIWKSAMDGEQQP